ncbi:MAG: hypothetical protein GXY25_23215 [Pirellulaceae bacterium]|jgi:hypothetical protein|nr:hypothetical protein [Thermoguttaceae bacterium]MDI9445356.1 hypothetical protein [Planctomycetota bacterium]NLZ03432.1 hypothetical protein [Pirellulaceae bacterium]
MDERPIFDPDILEAIEVFRGGEQDQGDPALRAAAEAARIDPNLAERLARIRDWDRRCADAIRQVAVPPELAPRIVELLKQRPTALAAVVTQSGSRDDALHPERPASRDALASAPPARRRRYWRWAVPAAASIAVAALGIWMVLGQDHRWPGPDELCRTAIGLFEAPAPAASEGAPMDDGAPPRAYPYSPHLLRIPRTQWRSVDQFGGRRAVAYDLPLEGGRRATLYVLRGRAERVPNAPPRQSQLQTRNLSVAAWQSGELIYVLVVDGGERAYRALLESTARPWT